MLAAGTESWRLVSWKWLLRLLLLLLLRLLPPLLSARLRMFWVVLGRLQQEGEWRRAARRTRAWGEHLRVVDLHQHRSSAVLLSDVCPYGGT